MRRDPLIIGGGPAGAAAAITLAQAGRRPTLIERASGSADKVCGDFLSADTIERARVLGVDTAALGAAPIHLVRLIRGERVGEATLPFPAMGLSRRVLDAALLAQADRAGVALRLGQTVRRLVQGGDGWIVQADGAPELRVETVFQATGKHDLRDLPRPHSKHDAVGMKMYFSLAAGPAKALEGATELTLFPGGYAGMQHVENGRSVLCIAVRRSGLSGGWDRLIDSIRQRSRRFAGMLQGAQPLLSRPLAVAGIPYGFLAQAAPPDGLFRLGDQAAVIPSLTGDGMAIALHSGADAATTWLAGGNATAYQQMLACTLRPQMRLAGGLHRVCMNGQAQTVAVQAAAWFPSVLRLAASRTRLPSDVRG